MVTKRDIEKARKAYWLKEAQKQVGSHIKSLDQVKVISKARKPKYSAGKSLALKYKKATSGFSAYKKKK